MIVTRQALDSLLKENVLDLRFARRITAPGKPPTRRMLCTKSYNLLNSINGRTTLNYRPPAGPKVFEEGKHNACIVWDILMQDYRIVPAESVNVIRQIPANEEFWKVFNEEIYPMSQQSKVDFMNS